MALKDWEQFYASSGKWSKVQIKSIIPNPPSELYLFKRKDKNDTLTIYTMNESTTKIITTYSAKIFKGNEVWSKVVRYAIKHMRTH